MRKVAKAAHYIDSEGERKSTSTYIEMLPDLCPYCHYSINPIGVTEVKITRGHKDYFEMVFQCPRDECRDLFLSYYQASDDMSHRLVLIGSAPVKPKGRDFDDDIKKISEEFPIIYNQALRAEELGLDRVAGMDYRRAFEFLIKDFLISELPKKAQEIKKKILGQCIQTYIENERIKQIAKRAAWLGSDETHYERRWINKDIEDLKRLIEITVHFISKERQASEYIDEMR